MLNRKKSKLDRLTDLLPKQEKSHTKRKMLGVAGASIAMAALAGVLTREKDYS